MVRVGAVLLLVLAISLTAYLLATVPFGVAVVAAIAATLSIHVLLTSSEVARYVQDYDNTPHQRPDSG